MNQLAYELGKKAAAVISRSVTIRLGKPGSGKKQRDALNCGKRHNSDGPWRKGRKVKKK